VLALPLVRFPGPLPEPDVRVPAHPALHEPRVQPVVLLVVVGSADGFAIFVPRYRYGLPEGELTEKAGDDEPAVPLGWIAQAVGQVRAVLLRRMRCLISGIATATAIVVRLSTDA
jgi:hypothetical protein